MGRTLGLTPNEYINEVRLVKAMELFQANPGGYSVKEMASKVGYRDEKYFSRQFKQRFGVLPSQFRSQAYS
ncbi:helix-turn-helix domain-containing protein [Haliscomenobacter sp.]|uniref:helix-turn-helix domain-containing protein n=1 Tax=Haliscomenobacter sp. TaxID=2717303 RepID=UPI003BA9F9F7